MLTEYVGVVVWRLIETLKAWSHEHYIPVVYRITGEDVNGMSFQGADEELLRRALGILEDQGKCAIFKGETSQEDGIKFF